MRTPQEKAAKDSALRELLGMVAKPLVDGLNVNREDKPTSATAGGRSTPDPKPQDDEIDMAKVMGFGQNPKRYDDSGSSEGGGGSNKVSMSLTELSSRSVEPSRSSRRGKKKRRR